MQSFICDRKMWRKTLSEEIPQLYSQIHFHQRKQNRNCCWCNFCLNVYFRLFEFQAKRHFGDRILDYSRKWEEAWPNNNSTYTQQWSNVIKNDPGRCELAGPSGPSSVWVRSTKSQWSGQDRKFRPGSAHSILLLY